MARQRFKVARHGVAQTKKRCFLVLSAHMQFLFISRCGGSVIRLPWRLPRYTLAYKPSNGKKSASCSVTANSVSPGWVKICFCRRKFSVSLMKPCSSVLVEKAGLISTESDDTEFLFLFLPNRFRARCLCHYARKLRLFRSPIVLLGVGGLRCGRKPKQRMARRWTRKRRIWAG